MSKAKFDTERCKGCGLCEDACPKHIIALSKSFNKMGYSYAECIKQDECIGCALCALMCPDVCITVE